MTNSLRSIAWFGTLVLLAGFPVASARAATTTIKASAKVVKSLTLTRKRDLDFGTIALSGAAGTVSISMTGVVTCGASLTCSGPAVPAIMNVSGSNGETVRIAVAQADLINAVDGSTIRFTPIAPATVTLTNSGSPGKDFNIGGSIAIPATADGLYAGNIQVTVDYQ